MVHQRHALPGGITKLEIVVLIVIVAVLSVLAGLMTPPVMKRSQASAKAQAVNNAKEIGTALLTFVEHYGSYPSESTRQQMITEGIKVIPSGNDANSYLGQLLAADCLNSEKFFYVKGISSREGDNIFDSPSTLLEAGENGFGYVMLKGDKPLSSPLKYHSSRCCSPQRRWIQSSLRRRPLRWSVFLPHS